MTEPDTARLLAALDATWPAARYHTLGPWCLREGAGGGQRVSAATADGAVEPSDIAAAEAGLRNLGQRPLFMLRAGDEALDAELDARGYEIVDPVTLYLAPVETLAGPLQLTRAIASWPPLAIQRELWAAGGIGPARIAVMERAADPKTSFLGRSGDTPGGTGFVSAHDGIAMLHALEVHPTARRMGVGAALMRAAANWAQAAGLRWITLAVTRANVPANGLYRRIGMHEATGYHYRRAPGDAA